MVEMMFGYFVESHAQIILKPASHQMRHKTLWQMEVLPRYRFNHIISSHWLYNWCSSVVRLRCPFIPRLSCQL